MKAREYKFCCQLICLKLKLCDICFFGNNQTSQRTPNDFIFRLSLPLYFSLCPDFWPCSNGPVDQLTPRHIFLWHKSKGNHFHFQLQQLKRAMIITYLSSRRRRRAAVEDRGSRIADRRSSPKADTQTHRKSKTTRMEEKLVQS